MSLSTVAHETFVIERIYDVPVAQTFRAWADPLLKAAGLPVLLKSWELLRTRLSVGGRETNRGGPPGGPSTRTSRSSETSSPSSGRLHVRNVCRRVPNLGVRRHGAVQRHDATSQLVLTEQGVFLDGHDTVAQREAGTRSLLDSLAASLKSGGS